MNKSEFYNISKLELGKRLLKERERKGCTQSEAAAGIGVSVNTLSNWECGNFYPKPVYIEALAEYYGCNPDYLTSSEVAFRTSKEERASRLHTAVKEKIDFFIDKDSAAKKERNFLISFYKDYMGWDFFGWCGLMLYRNGSGKHLFIPAAAKRISSESMDSFMKELEENFVSVEYGAGRVTATDETGKTSELYYPEPDHEYRAAIDEPPERVLHSNFEPQYYVFAASDGYHVLAISEFLNFADSLKAFIQSGTQSMESRLPVLRGWNESDSKSIRSDILSLYLSHIK